MSKPAKRAAKTRSTSSPTFPRKPRRSPGIPRRYSQQPETPLVGVPLFESIILFRAWIDQKARALELSGSMARRAAQLASLLPKEPQLPPVVWKREKGTSSRDFVEAEEAEFHIAPIRRRLAAALADIARHRKARRYTSAAKALEDAEQLMRHSGAILRESHRRALEHRVRAEGKGRLEASRKATQGKQAAATKRAELGNWWEISERERGAGRLTWNSFLQKAIGAIQNRIDREVICDDDGEPVKAPSKGTLSKYLKGRGLK